MTAETIALGGARHWNDRHLAAILERLRIGLAIRIAPDRVAEITPRLEELDREEADAEAALAAMGQAPTLRALSQRCGLDAFATGTIALCLAAEVDADAASMLPRAGIGGRLTPGLALALLGDGAPSRALAFAPDAPLMALRLLELEPGQPLDAPGAAPARPAARA